MSSYNIADDPPFTHTGLDFAGPLYVQESPYKEATPRYIAIYLFTCTSTLAIHLELARGLNVDGFLLAF